MKERFLDDDFLLDSKTAVDLYERFARRQPIIDYHCHLSPQQIADDHRWRSITEIWLEGDHYKWRAMRADRRPRADHHRRRVRLGQVRGVGGDGAADAAQPALPLDAPRARVPVRRDGQAARARHREGDLRALQPQAGRGRRSRRRGCWRSTTCKVVCSTDDPIDDLEPHRRHAKNAEARTKLYPTWRPDKALAVHDLAAWNAWVDKLGAAADMTIDKLAGLREALQQAARLLPRGRLPRRRTTGWSGCFAAPYTEREVRGDLREGARAASALSPDEIEKLRAALTLRLRRDGSRARLGAAVPPRRPAQQQHARDARARARHRLRLDRRLPAGRGAGALPRPARSARGSWRRRSSTT